MKTHFLFCSMLALITFSIFTWKAETILGMVFGYIGVIVSTAIFSKNMIDKIAPGRDRTYQ